MAVPPGEGVVVALPSDLPKGPLLLTFGFHTILTPEKAVMLTVIKLNSSLSNGAECAFSIQTTDKTFKRYPVRTALNRPAPLRCLIAEDRIVDFYDVAGEGTIGSAAVYPRTSAPDRFGLVLRNCAISWIRLEPLDDLQAKQLSEKLEGTKFDYELPRSIFNLRAGRREFHRSRTAKKTLDVREWFAGRF